MQNPLLKPSLSMFPKRHRSSLSAFTRITALSACGGLAIALYALAPLPTHAQAGGTAPLYNGGDPKNNSAMISSWGSGAVSVDTAHVYAGSGSLKIVTHGQYQGGGLSFSKPFDLGAFVTSKDAYLQFALMPPVTPGATNGGPNGTAPGIGINGPAGFGGPGSPNSGGGSSATNPYGSGRDSNNTKSRFTKAHALENVRIVFITSSGKSLEMRVPISYATDENNWKVLSIPVSVIPGLKADDAQIKQILLFGDVTGTMYLGKIGLIQDSNHIMIGAMEDKVVTVNQTYRYNASAHGGVSPLVYSWDWDASDGIQDESQGRSATHLYRKSGDYKVTVTVTDPFGVKAPASTTFNIHIP